MVERSGEFGPADPCGEPRLESAAERRPNVARGGVERSVNETPGNVNTSARLRVAVRQDLLLPPRTFACLDLPVVAKVPRANNSLRVED